MSEPATSELRNEKRRPRFRAVGVVGAIVAWFGLWFFTPGLHSAGIGTLVTNDDTDAVLIESILALVLALILVLLHRRMNRELFARDWSIWLYALPIATGIALPFHYGLPLPVALYMFWMSISVFWQNYLTFGLLQRYLARWLPTWGVLTLSAIIFWAGHALFLPESFAPIHVVPSLAILALGFVHASLRIWFGTLHLILALHLTFYFIFA